MRARDWRLMHEHELTELFRIIGAQDPEARARLQLEKAIANLPRDLFWLLAVGEATHPSDRDWLTIWRSRRPNDPGGEFGPAIDRLLAAGARVEHLTTIVVIMQMSLLVALCELLDDPGQLEPEVSDIRWRLFLIGEDNRPTAPITGLADLVWEDDPVDAGVRPVRQTKARAAAAGEWRSMNEQELTELFRKLVADDPRVGRALANRRGHPSTAPLSVPAPGLEENTRPGRSRLDGRDMR